VEIAVIGAGPYGLAAASHLRAAGAEVRIFGKAMDFWASQMPHGMLLRSPWSGSNIGDPQRRLTLDRYELSLGSSLQRQLPLEDFVRYGQWFQLHALPDLDMRNVSAVDRSGAGFQIRVEDGESFFAQKIVVATGIGSFANRPGPFGSLPSELVSHTSDRGNHNLARFAGQSIAVIGAGQSGLESAALLTESGAQVEVLTRQPAVRWLNKRPAIEWLMDSWINPFKAPAKIGPIGINWLFEHPSLFTMMSRERQDAMAYRAIRPAVSSWVRPRTERVKITSGRHVTATAVKGGQVLLQLNDGSRRTVDHVLLATGYKIDIACFGFLSRELLKNVRTARGYPELGPGFESSFPGLYFVGATAAYSFGPYFRFVAGTRYAAKALARHAVSSAPPLG